MPITILITTAAVSATIPRVLPPELTFPPTYTLVDDDYIVEADSVNLDNVNNINNITTNNNINNINTGTFVNKKTTAENDSVNDNIDDEKIKNINFSSYQMLFDQSYTGSNAVTYGAAFGNLNLEQSIRHDLRRDRLRNTRQHINASGLIEGERYGLDWIPVVQYSNDRGGQNSLATLDIGPTIRYNLLGVPLHLRSGLSVRRVDSLSGADAASGSRGSAGAYGAFAIGDYFEQFPYAPIYFSIDGLGRHIENSSMASLNAAALGAMRVGENDSVFIYANAVTFNGREGYLESSADGRVAHFVETPWRVENTYGVMIGYVGTQRMIFFPSAYYGVHHNTLEFRNDSRLRDERTVRQTLSAGIATDTSASLIYSGAITFEWRDHDRLFGASDFPTVATATNIDSLNVNLWDYNSFDPRTTHRVELRLPMNFRARYDFSANRFLSEYPNYYINGGDSIINIDDSDRRTLHHRVALAHGVETDFAAEIFYDAIQYDLVFLKSAKSSSNRTDNTHRAGARFEWLAFENLLITETLVAEAKRGSFHFPQFHQSALSRPRYSRAFSSRLAAEWDASALLGFRGEWGVKYSDYGFWYGREYMTSVLEQNPFARVDYYAITGKSYYHTFDAAANFSFGDNIIEAGCATAIARDRHYESGNYILTNENGLTIKPYASALFGIYDRIEIEARVSRTFTPGNREQNFWDFRMQASGGF